MRTRRRFYLIGGIIAVWICICPVSLSIKFTGQACRRVKVFGFLRQLEQKSQDIESISSSYDKSDKIFDYLKELLADYKSGSLTSSQIRQVLAIVEGRDDSKILDEIREFLGFLTHSPPVDELESVFERISKLRDSGFTEGDKNFRGLKEIEKEMKEAQEGDVTSYLRDEKKNEKGSKKGKDEEDSREGNEARFKRIYNGYKLSRKFEGIEREEFVKKQLIPAVPFLGYYLKQLELRAKTVGDENVLAIARTNDLKITVIPFMALRCLRGGKGARGLEYMADGTMRQYIAFHTYPANFYGLAITEAENKPGITQGDHNHGGFEEETIFFVG